MVSGTQASSSTEENSTSEAVSAMTCPAIHLLVRDKTCINQFLGPPTKTKELGVTEIPEEMFMELLRDISDRYTERTYNVITNNCNNFTDEVAMLLIGEGIPRDIVDLPKMFMNTPLGQQMMPMLM